VRNEEITARTGLPSLSATICCRRSAIFGHLARLGDVLPAHKALHSCVRLSQGRLPDSTWKRRPGRPRGRWIDRPAPKRQQPPACWSMEAGYQAWSQRKSDATVQRLRDYLTWPGFASANYRSLSCVDVYYRMAGCMTCYISVFTSVFLRSVHRAVNIRRLCLSEFDFILSRSDQLLRSFTLLN